MIELLEADLKGIVLAYITIDEKKMVNRLFNLKAENAVYYKKGKKIAYQWLLNPITVKRLFKKLPILKLPPE